MKRLRRYGFAVCAITLGTGILIACGGDDSVVLATPDGGDDGRAPDSSNDGTTSPDVTTTDVITPPVNDAGSDVDAPDARDSAAPKDAQADVDIPPVDAGPPDADASDLAAEFPARVTAEICRTAARCCFGNENLPSGGAVDGGTYNQSKCNGTYANGFDQSSPGATVDFSKVTYDQAKATECLGRIKGLSCGANAAEFRAAVAACYATFTGKQAAGATCALSSECQPGFFCNTGKAGGPVCEAIRDTPSACGDWTTNAGLAQHSCSNRFSSVPPRFCRFSAVGGSGGTLPPSSWTCNNALPAGSACQNDTWCDSTTVCSFDTGDVGPTCKGFASLFQGASCQVFVTPP